MIGYDRNKRSNFFHYSEIMRWKKQGWVSEEEFKTVDKKLMPRYEHTNFFIRAGLFLLTVVIISAGLGLCALFVSNVISESNFWFFSLLAAGVLFLLLQTIVIGQRNQFRSGMDDATLYSALLFMFIAFFLLFEDSLFDDELRASIFFLAFFSIPAVIYLDRLLVAITVLIIYGVSFIIINKLGELWAVPFIMMIISAALYVLSKKAGVKTTSKAVEQCWDIVLWIAITMFYVSGNCFVVIELSIELLKVEDASGVPFQWVFYVFTVVVPMLYIFFGLYKKQLSLLNIGLLAVAVSVMSIRYYHHLMTFEYALILGGMFLIAVAWLALRYWKNDNNGITLKPDEDTTDGLNLESLIVIQTLGTQTDSTESFEGGGGKFGGGGASGQF
jgi:uncharacterized membrane protein YgcG